MDNKELTEKMIQEFEDRRMIIDGCIQVLKSRLRQEESASNNQLPTSSNKDTGENNQVADERGNLNREKGRLYSSSNESCSAEKQVQVSSVGSIQSKHKAEIDKDYDNNNDLACEKHKGNWNLHCPVCYENYKYWLSEKCRKEDRKVTNA